MPVYFQEDEFTLEKDDESSDDEDNFVQLPDKWRKKWRWRAWDEVVNMKLVETTLILATNEVAEMSTANGNIFESLLSLQKVSLYLIFYI